jgi:hypothetical protein
MFRSNPEHAVSMLRIRTLIGACAIAAVAGACGSTTHPNSQSSTASSGGGGVSTSASTPAAGAAPATGPLSAEAISTGKGDIPDNQVYLPFHNTAGGYTMIYPEGWTRQGTGTHVVLSAKNNIVRIVISAGGPASPAAVTSELTALKQSSPTLQFAGPKVIQLKSGSAVKATYTTRSAPNAVTGKSVLLIVDRYVLSKGGRRATIDLGTPQGVDNVDAYRGMINSFRWQ